MKREIVFPQCNMCGERRRGTLEKFQNGLLIKGKFVCWKCHNNINNLNVSNENYSFYKEQLKKILY